MNERIISTNTVFHYTKTFENIIGILTNDFKPQYGIEDVLGSVFGFDDKEIAVQMVCFCDIPLSQIKRHSLKYGNYAIGLSKDWAIRNKINPLVYVYRGSGFTEYFIDGLVEANKTDKHIDSILDSLIGSVQYLKPYEGKIWNKGERDERLVRFYDEREWRYIPIGSQPLFLNIEQANKELGIPVRSGVPFSLSDIPESDKTKHRLSFTPDDIRFIIVQKESELHKMVESVIRIKGDKFTHKQLEILRTRIISMEMIEENF